MKTVTIYTDGACSGNPGPGGWGAILVYGARGKGAVRRRGATPPTTAWSSPASSGRCSCLKEPCVVELYSDSKYVIDALSKGWAVRLAEARAG